MTVLAATCGPQEPTALVVGLLLFLGGAVLLILAGGQPSKRGERSSQVAGSVCLLVAALLIGGVFG